MYVMRKPLKLSQYSLNLSRVVKSTTVVYLPIRLRADLISYGSSQCSVAFLERWTVRIGDVKVKRSVLEYIRAQFISQMRSILSHACVFRSESNPPPTSVFPSIEGPK